ncbi:receptor-like protein 20 [Corylus avellana]|uniref:receptor-like protein 20 n=1 Tax=Corylus avellana TaxID=13451 RepID=UPI00286B4BBE|nr:receptor-like protein 20 [Corylus avellana]
MRIPVLFSCLFLIFIFCISMSSGQKDDDIYFFPDFSQCLGDEQSLLLQWKNSLVFDNALSTKLVYWNQSVDCCSWEGVICDGSRVIILDLTNESISDGLDNSSSLSCLRSLQYLGLAYNKLKTFPHFLRNQSALLALDLSNNEIHGEIPNWIWNLPYLYTLNLSYNYLMTLDLPLLGMSNLRVLDLHSNQLQGQLLAFPKHAIYLDFSRNNFSSVILPSIGNSFGFTSFLSLSSNKFYGSIPESICNITNLRLLDLSNNSLSGTIPQCLFKMSESHDVMWHRGLGVLNLRKNNLTGVISNSFPRNCSLQTLYLNDNQLQGKLPKSLARCTSLEVLDLGNNQIEDVFPCYLKNISMLHILVLRSNKFYGPIDCPMPNASWSMLQIVDLAANSFTGKLPIKYFSDWKVITDERNEAQYQVSPLRFVDNSSFYAFTNYGVAKIGFGQPYSYEDVVNIYYQNMVTITIKGVQVELVKILTIFASLDFSCNHFDGHIPREIGELKSLRSLNLSHNAFTGQMSQSLGKLTYLESLDLSSNKFTGEIPVQLAEGLIFLSFLNLSFNQLGGNIPLIKQFATFSKSSYEGNIGLCGFPLKEKCTHEESELSHPTSKETHSDFGRRIDWNFLNVEFGFIFGFGIVIWPLMFWKRWRICYFQLADDIFFKMFPQLYIRKSWKTSTHKSETGALVIATSNAVRFD